MRAPFVLDASALVEALLRTAAGARVERRLVEGRAHAPELIDVEVLSALTRLARAGVLTREHAGRALRLALDAPVTRVRHAGVVARAWSHTDRVSAYDAVYVALADALDCPLVTTDRRLARSPDPGVDVVLISRD